MIIINLLLSPNSTEMRQEVSPEKIPVFFFRFVLFTPKTCLRVNRFSCESFTSCVQTCTYTHWATRAHERWWQDKTLNICSQSVSEVDTDFVWLFSEERSRHEREGNEIKQKYIQIIDSSVDQTWRKHLTNNTTKLFQLTTKYMVQTEKKKNNDQLIK